MKRFIFLLALAVAASVSTRAQDPYDGQAVVFHLASGDSLTDALGHYQPRVKDGKIVWRSERARVYEVKDVESIEFLTPEQSLTSAREALIKLYKALDGDHWANNTNWCTDKPLDEWHGVMTNRRPYVWSLNLEGNNLKGEIPDMFVQLGPTEIFNLSGNKISGRFPNLMKNLNFGNLWAFNNEMTGELPEELFNYPGAWILQLSENKLTGKIPASLVNLMDDKNHLDISGNDFSGEVPEAILNHPRFNLMWNLIVPQSGHLVVPTIPGYRLEVTDLNGNKFNTTDIYKENQYTLIFDYESARGDFTSKLMKAYETYKKKGFEVIGLAPADVEELNEFLHTNNISWLNLEPASFKETIGRYYAFTNFVNLVDRNGNVVFSSIMDENGKMEDTWGSSTRDQMVFDVLAEKFGNIDYTPYTSADYSHDGEVMTLQKATVGKGVDIVFVGNCFVDKDIESGLYEQRMKEAMEQFFAYEPYTSLRNRFNVYAVIAVSPNKELYEDTKQAIMSDADAFDYAQKIATLIPNRPMRVNVIHNSYNAGRCYTTMYNDHSYVAFMFDGVNRVLNHEGGGHGVGRLYDEYIEQAGSTATQEVKDYYEQMWKDYGRGANIDMHADVTQTRWARLAADSRYAGEGLGAYEGSGTIAFGVYRPTRNSMMRYNDIPFNAPSREAIYKYVMQESEGPGWTYDYERFVKFDEKGRAEFAASQSNNAPQMRTEDADSHQTSINVTEGTEMRQRSLPPVAVQGTWQDALKHPRKISYSK